MERIDRSACKARVRELLRTAQVSPMKVTAVWLGLRLALSFLSDFGGGMNPFYAFLLVLTFLLTITLDAGFILYCMAIRRGERAEYLTLFDGFAFAGKIILLTLLELIFIGLWSMLFVIPGLVACYRYRFALYNLLENPQISVTDAISMSKLQTRGLKGQLFALDLSYLGWALLSFLPQSVYNQSIQVQVYNIVGASNYWSVQDVMRYINPNVFGMPALAWEFLIAVWAFVVGTQYLAHYRCVELEYFDAAKRFSGVGELPYDNGGYQNHGDYWNGGYQNDGYPDNGGYQGGDGYQNDDYPDNGGCQGGDGYQNDGYADRSDGPDGETKS